MSVLRLLSPIRGGSLSRNKSTDDITLTLRVPSYGTVFMKPPDDPLWPIAISEAPRNDQLLHGELDIHVPPGGKRRCKAIRVGLRTVARLNMGPTRGWEEDVIFERKCEVIGGTADGLWLEEGLQRFDFTLILPATLAPHDWHHNGKVTQHLFAELDGQEETSLFSFRRNSSRGSFSSGRGSSTSGKQTPASNLSRSRSPSPLASGSSHGSPQLSAMITAAGSLSITRQESHFDLPKAPTYEQSQAAAGKKPDEGWIVGTHSAERDVMVIYNPNPQAGHSDLDERQSGYAPGIGVYDLKLFSDVFSVGAPVHNRTTLPGLSPKTTIFSWRLLLSQTHTITSPRDAPSAQPKPTTRYFTLVEHGAKPPKGVLCPGVQYPALWRGTEAGGDSTGILKIEGNGMMPRDDRGRPSTLPGVVTPIKVSHSLIYEIYFSIWGEDDHGNAMAKDGPGGLRYFRVERPIIVPSCALIPHVLNLPVYSFRCPLAPCTTCGIRKNDNLCSACPPSILPHPRHDLPPALVGVGDGSCPECSKSVIPQGQPPNIYDNCACGVDLGNLEERMKRFILEGVETDYTDDGNQRVMREKEDAERGRTRRRSPVRERRL